MSYEMNGYLLVKSCSQNVGVFMLFSWIYCDFIIRAWNNASVQPVVRLFKKCGVSDSVRDAADHLLWQVTNM
jgi:hypothetical protein